MEINLGVEFIGDVDLASIAIWSFWLFFAGLVYYLQRENMREGYPLEKEDGSIAPNQGPFPVPSPKTFIMPGDHPNVVVPSPENEAAHRRDSLALARVAMSEGFPHAPTGDPLVDGVGPASWVPRGDHVEPDGAGHPKIQPMGAKEGFIVSAGYDPRGMPVVAKDDPVVGTVRDVWIDVPEQLIRYLEVDLDPAYGGGVRLLPMQFVRVKPRYVDLKPLSSGRVAGIPTIAVQDRITLLEEEKITAYCGGGFLYDLEKGPGKVWVGRRILSRLFS